MAAVGRAAAGTAPSGVTRFSTSGAAITVEEWHQKAAAILMAQHAPGQEEAAFLRLLELRKHG